MGRPIRTDAELVAACRGGDREAFGEIVERYQRVVDAVAYSATRDRTLGEDITQDTFITAWRQLPALREVDRLPAWLCGIARNLAIRARGKRNRETALDDRHVAGGGSSYEQLSDREDEHVVATSLAKVPETYREALVLFYCEQQSVKSVARALGISENATHQRLARGRQHLADHVVVERTLERRRPRAGLVAAVLAAIATLGSSQVEASTLQRTQRSTMFKFGIAAVLLVAIAGTGYVVVARSNTEPDVTSSSTSTSTTPTTGSNSSRAVSTSSPSTTAPVKSRSGTADTDPIGCASVARHIAMMTGMYNPDFVTAIEKGNDEYVERSIKPFFDEYVASCTSLSWSVAIRTCIASVDDFVGLQTKCEPPPMLPSKRTDRQVIVDDEPRPAYTGSDESCASVGRHLAALQRPTEAMLAKLSPAARDEHVDAMNRMLESVPETVETNCETAPWSLAVRRCMLASTTHNQALGCPARVK